MYRIAVYGKGGVGKSTVSANISFGLSERGHTVLHVGCDPKHDSTRLLMGGENVSTFSDDPDILPLMTSTCGASCIECGGASAGEGCAGKGMSLLFSKLSDVDAEYRVCDVLGDVVCGGFSYPMRRDNVDAILLVSSGEYMSLYAMNNIIRGLRNVNGTSCIAGIVFNRRGDPGEEVMMRRYSEAVGIPVICDIPRDPLFGESESEGHTLLESYPDSIPAGRLKGLIDGIEGRLALYPPVPLTEASMADLASGRPITGGKEAGGRKRECTFEHYDHERNLTFNDNYLLPSCTSHGAVDAGLKVSDLAIVVHGPANCSHLMEFAFRRRFGMDSPERGGRLPPCNIYSTRLDGNRVFTGDIPYLEDAVRRAASDGFEHIFIVPTCTSEILGTDLSMVASRLSEELSLDVAAVPGDENFLGSRFGCLDGLISLLIDRMDPDVEREEGGVNLISRTFMAMGRDRQSEEMERILGSMGMHLNMRFVDFCSMDDIRNFCKAELDIQLDRSNVNTRMCDKIAKRTGRERALILETPIGLRDTVDWIRQICSRTGRDSVGPMEQSVRRYTDGMQPIIREMEGKRAAIYCYSHSDIEWQVLTLLDMGMTIDFIMFSKGNFIDHNEKVPEFGSIETIRDGSFCEFRERISKDRPDIVITNHHSKAQELDVPWCSMMPRGYGIDGALEWARRVRDCMHLPAGRGWEAGL